MGDILFSYRRNLLQTNLGDSMFAILKAIIQIQHHMLWK
ncbi:hypothetical protein WN943_026327 [Citrus x changshan-huyou]